MVFSVVFLGSYIQKKIDPTRLGVIVSTTFIPALFASNIARQ